MKTASSISGKYEAIPVRTGYIKPKQSYDIIIDSLVDTVEEDDFLVISETPLAISQGRIVDESKFKPSWAAYLLADWWSKYLWGYILGPLLGVKDRTIRNLKKLPPEARSHKELILRYYGWKHALKPASEAGVDLSNAPGTYVSLLPEKSEKVVEDISSKIHSRTGKSVTVMIIDTDATYKLAGINFTSLPYAIPQIKSDLGIFAYLLGRIGTIQGPTPLAVSRVINLEKILEVALMAEECQKENDVNMETVYDMTLRFKEDLSGVTVDMLDSVPHTPAVIVRTL
ncbi:MAG: coenzyme F420-0:L-glutamate ligase [Methanobacteriaceae archaeon]